MTRKKEDPQPKLDDDITQEEMNRAAALMAAHARARRKGREDDEQFIRGTAEHLYHELFVTEPHREVITHCSSSLPVKTDLRVNHVLL